MLVASSSNILLNCSFLGIIFPSLYMFILEPSLLGELFQDICVTRAVDPGIWQFCGCWAWRPPDKVPEMFSVALVPVGLCSRTVPSSFPRESPGPAPWLSDGVSLQATILVRQMVEGGWQSSPSLWTLIEGYSSVLWRNRITVLWGLRRQYNPSLTTPQSTIFRKICFIAKMTYWFFLACQVLMVG